MKRFLSLPVFVGLITVLVAVFWLVNSRFFPVHDFSTGARLFDLHQAVLDGHLPPRWAKNFGFGSGMPLFEFYAPLSFYVAEIFHLAGFSILASLKLSWIAATALGFAGAYLLGRKLTNTTGGLIAAVTFTLAPYHAVNLFVRGALAEYWATAFMPWIVYYSLRPRYLGLTLALVGLLLSHNVTVLTFLPFWLVFVVGYNLISKTPKKLLLAFSALVHAGVIAAFFLGPAFLQKGFTRVAEITGGFSQFQLHFIYFRQLFVENFKYGGSVLGLNDDMSFYLGWDIIFLAAVGGLASFFSRRKFNLASLIAFLTLAALFATNFKSQFLWQRLPLVEFIQFPWRFLGVATFFLSLLTAFVAFLPASRRYLPWGLGLVIILNGRFFRPSELIPAVDLYRPSAESIVNSMGGVIPDYLPPGVDWAKLTPISAPAAADNPEAKLAITKDTTDELSVTVKNFEPTTVSLNRFVFPNWRVTINGQLADCYVDNFTYRCRLPAGENQVKLFWQETGVNRTSNIISLVGLITLAVIYFYPRYESRNF